MYILLNSELNERKLSAVWQQLLAGVVELLVQLQPGLVQANT